MSPLIGANGNYSGLSVSTPDTHGGTPTDVAGRHGGVHIAKADGLRGDLGLYAVTANGATRYMTREELTAAVSELKSGSAAYDVAARTQAATAPRGGGGFWSWMLEIYMKQLGDELNETVNQM